MVSGTCLRIVVFPSDLEHNRTHFLQCVCMKYLQVSLIINVSGIISKSSKPYSWCKNLFYRVSIHQCESNGIISVQQLNYQWQKYNLLFQCNSKHFLITADFLTEGILRPQSSQTWCCVALYMVNNISEVTVATIFTTCSPEDVGSRFLCNTGCYLNNWSHPRGLQD